MRGAAVMMYWVLSILFVLASFAVPAAILMAIWNDDGRWMLTALVCGCTAVFFMFLAAMLEVERW